MAKRDSRDEPERQFRKVRKFIRGSRVAMLTTQAPDGTLRSRPMATVEAEFDGDLWFFTRASAPKAVEITDHAQVNVAYADVEDGRFVSVSGTAMLVHDPERVQQLWSRRLKAWFPDGKRDPDLALIRVRIAHAEYWSDKAGAMVQAVGLVRSEAPGPQGSEAQPADAPATPTTGAAG